MASGMYGSTDDGDLVELKETVFDQEIELQDFLARYPYLMAGDQMNPTDPRRFVLVTTEAGIPISEGAGDHFSADAVFIDQDGIPTIVEVKRSKDARVRRDVIGQLLEYAACACTFWTATRLRSLFEERCAKLGVEPELEIRAFEPAPTGTADDLWEKVSQNLKQEHLRLVFLSDKFPSETQRIIEFLNRQMQLTEVYAIEVRQYRGANIRTIVPRVLNPSVLESDRRTAATERGLPWTETRFFDALAQKHGAVGNSANVIFRKIFDWATAHSRLWVDYGRGKTSGSIIVVVKRSNSSAYESGRDVPIMTLWTYGRVELDFAYLMRHEPFIQETKRKELLQRLTAGSTLQIPTDKIDKFPSIPWSQLTEGHNLSALLTSMEWVTDELHALR